MVLMQWIYLRKNSGILFSGDYYRKYSQMDDRLGEDVCKGLNIEMIQRMSSKQTEKVEKWVRKLAKNINRHKMT